MWGRVTTRRQLRSREMRVPITGLATPEHHELRYSLPELELSIRWTTAGFTHRVRSCRSVFKEVVAVTNTA